MNNNNVLYAGGARPSTGGDNSGGGNIDTSGLLKTDVSNLTVAGRSVISGIATDSISLEGLADVDLSNLTAEGQAVIAGIVDSNVNLEDLAKTDLSNLLPGLFFGSESGDNYIKFSNGVILQWGAGSWGNGNKSKLVTLPMPYVSYFRGFAIYNSGSASANSSLATAVNGLTGLTVSKAVAATSDNESFSWFTIGK